jgi:hypothetical protein
MNAKLMIMAVGLLICFSSRADACTCVTILPCQAYAGAQVVFVGVVTKTGFASSKGLTPSTAMSMTLTNGANAAHFRIEETLLGTEKAEVDVFGEGTTCDYHFKEGGRYLVYAYRSQDGTTLHTNICSGTAPVSESLEHLRYLRGVKQRPSGSVFSGRIGREFVRQSPQGVAVIIESGGSIIRARTNVRGEFVFANLSRGHYRVHTVPRANYSSLDVMAEIPKTEWEIDIPDHGCRQEWFQIRPQGEISGQLIGEIEQSRNLWLDILPANATKRTRTGFDQARVNAYGQFRFSFLPPGRYLVGFNLESGPHRDYPYPEFYYPGVTNRTLAKVITVGDNERVDGIALPIPTPVAERKTEGVAVWPNNQPAVNVWIELINPRMGWRDGNGVQTDEMGRFSIVGMEGQSYHLSALVHKGISLVHSQPLMIRVQKVNSPLRLVIRVP